MATRRKRATADSQLPAESSGSQVEAEGGELGYEYAQLPPPDEVAKVVLHAPPKGMGPVIQAFKLFGLESPIVKRTPFRAVCGVCNQKSETSVVEAKITGCSKWFWKPICMFNPCCILITFVGMIMLIMGSGSTHPHCEDWNH